MKTKNVMLFAYDFPHKKTQDFIYRLLIEKYNIRYVVGAPWKKLSTPAPSVRISPANFGLIETKIICRSFGVKYFKSDHNSRRTKNILKNNEVDLYIISGARILDEDVIKLSKNKVLNIHPGLLPEVRGLDTLLWSIHYNLPIGITSHFISSKIDSGKYIYKEKLTLNKDDTILDVSLRLLEKQSDVLIKTLRVLKNKDIGDFKNLDSLASSYKTKMKPDLEIKTVRKFNNWVRKHS